MIQTNHTEYLDYIARIDGSLALIIKPELLLNDEEKEEVFSYMEEVNQQNSADK